ncbi:1736_t:CDS:2 [Entrophospora sp. SA101]|nr:13601_t:CDS:2 [Entrophospora sp. SA101]CAJ0903141.1 1736_t:CDS:2 [Entrophospora sp. SA101]
MAWRVDNITTVDNKPTSATNDTAASSSSPFATPNDNKGINENEIIGSSIIDLTRNNNTYDSKTEPAILLN